jgi:TolB protein
VRDLSTNAARRVALDGEVPAVSPDGRSVAFSRRGHTYVVRPDGSGLRDLGEGGCAVWSPDSTRLAMCTSDDSVFVLRVDTGDRTPVPTGPGPNDPSAWSPDGTTLALESSRDGNVDVYVVGIDGMGERRLTNAEGNQSVDAWLAQGLLVMSSPPDAPANDYFLVDPTSGSPAAIPWLHAVPDPIGYAPSG